ncbi:hypothetical protein SAMN02745121_04500 [Nannocystis exedens]|uniref:Uncharacterized protein n=1 Tax=Nannocystis exedens TaxID=54 RepID=A0A1I2B0Z5_9BACT|nr:hypothetical protein [Nannocystis exedens]SFE49736.1 hypothetical protein SAMN02745121_04500 [Nannocystis exedens]
MRADEVIVVITGRTRRDRADAGERQASPGLATRPPRPARPSTAALALILSFETASARAAVPVDLSLEPPSPRHAIDLSSEPAAHAADATLPVSEHPSFETASARAAVLAPLRSSSATSVAVAIDLSLAPPAPSPRDLAYERGQAAKEAGDDARAGDEFARAYRLTAADETGPRLMLLRESVDARLRAHERGGDAREQLCPARALLREHLAGAGADPLADERARLARVEQGLAAVDCDAPAGPAPQGPSPRQPAPEDTFPSSPRPVPRDTSPVPPSTSPAIAAPRQPDPKDMSGPPASATRPGRALRIAGAAVLGVGAAALVPMGVGIALARDATRDGRRVCWGMDIACDGGNSLEVQEILNRGYDADRIVRIAAPIAGVALLGGFVLLGVGLALRARPPVALAPRLGPGTLGVGLQGRF